MPGALASQRAAPLPSPGPLRPEGARTLVGSGETIRTDFLPDRDWDALVAEFEDAAYDQTACFAGGQWGGGRTSHIALFEGGVCVAGALIVVFRPPFFQRGLAYIRSGPFWRRKGRPADIETYRRAVKAVADEYGTSRGHYLAIVPRCNPEFVEAEATALRGLGFEVGRPNPDPNRYFIDLALKEDEQLRSLDQKWRYNLKKALKNGFEISVGDKSEDIASFDALHASMVERKGFYAGDPVHLLPRLATELPPSLQPAVVLARREGKPVVGAVIVRLGDTALYLFGASAETALPLKAGYALQWWLVNWLSAEGLRWYDLGGEAMNDGLRQFKQGFVGKSGRVAAMPGDFECGFSFGGRLSAELVFAMRGARRVLRSWRN